MKIGQNFYDTNSLRRFGVKKVGENVQVHASCELVGIEHMVFGDNVRVDPWVQITAGEAGVEIGSHVHIGTSSLLAGTYGIRMGHFSALSHGCKVYSATDDYLGEGLTNPTVPIEYRLVHAGIVVIARHGLIGSNAVILPGAVIREGTSIGALSLVGQGAYLDPWSVYAGIPVRLIGKRRRDLMENYEAELLDKSDSQAASK